jgi:hypothetical protein
VDSRLAILSGTTGTELRETYEDTVTLVSCGFVVRCSSRSMPHAVLCHRQDRLWKRRLDVATRLNRLTAINAVGKDLRSKSLDPNRSSGLIHEPLQVTIRFFSALDDDSTHPQFSWMLNPALQVTRLLSEILLQSLIDICPLQCYPRFPLCPLSRFSRLISLLIASLFKAFPCFLRVTFRMLNRPVTGR